MYLDKRAFEERLRRIDPDFQPSPLRRILHRPRRRIVIPMRAPAYALVFAYLVLTVVKLAMVQELGPEGFEARRAELAQGDPTARVAARLLFVDPVFAYAARNI